MKTLVFAGAGLSTLSLLVRLIDNGTADRYRIRVYERSDKSQNDRTWCFWEEKPGYFEELVYARWKQLSFFSTGFSDELQMGDYSYKMIRGIDFYRFCLKKIRQHPQVQWHSANVRAIRANGQSVEVELENGTLQQIDDAIGFNSIPHAPLRQPGDIVLLQHFKGWRIKAAPGSFDHRKARLMDFRISQQEGTSFIYLLPLSDSEALVEYTLFTEKLLEPQAYDTVLHQYCSLNLQLKEFDIVENEFGIIPMTNLDFPAFREGIIQLGTAGGRTKASSGYTFQFVQKQSDDLASQIAAGEWPLKPKQEKRRFRFYDHTLLRVLKDQLMPGHEVFAHLFRKNPAHRVFRFLDNETRILVEIRILASLPVWPFFKAAMRKRSAY